MQHFNLQQHTFKKYLCLLLCILGMQITHAQQNALDFDGVDDYVSLGNDALVTELGASFTIETWIKVQSYSTLSPILSRWQPGNGASDFYFYIGDTGFVGISNTIGEQVMTLPGAVPLNTWTHVALSYDQATTTVSIYIDGILSSRGPLVGGLTSGNTLPLLIGGVVDDPGPNVVGQFPLQIDELRIWSGLRACEQILDGLNCELAGTELNLAAYYQFNESTGATLPDLAGANDGTLNTFALTGTTSNWVTSTSGVSNTICTFTTDFPEIALRDATNTIDIPTNNTPAPTDGTDFGTVAGVTSRTFTIRNFGDVTLNISQFISSNPDFAVNTVLESVGPVGIGTFEVTYTPGTSGTAIISIFSDDCDEPEYTFNVSATFVGVPIVDVSGSDFGFANENILKANSQRVYSFQLSATGGDITLTNLLTQVTSGNYQATDIANFELYYNNASDDFANAILLATSSLPSAGNGEVIGFNGLSQTIVGDGSPRYFYIAANVNPTAVTGRTFILPFLAAGDFTFDISPNLFGSSFGSSGTKTITDAPLPFITTWSTTDGQITIPAVGTYNITWTNLTNAGVGEGSITGEVDEITITGLANNDTYRVSISGGLQRMFFNFQPYATKILTIEQWGDIAWQTMGNAFAGCSNLTYNATDVPNMTSVDATNNMFNGATVFDDNLSSWDMSSVTNISSMFLNATAFNNGGVALTWDVSNVTNMAQMFLGASAFNQNLGAWDISSVTNMASMLNGTALSQANYDATLIGWANLDAGESQIPTNVTLGATGLTYCAGASARTTLDITNNWTITGDAPDCPFITTWQTTTANETITIPLEPNTTYNFTVNWGDGNNDTYNGLGSTLNPIHTYASGNTYTVAISGTFPRIHFNNAGDRQKILTIEQWGNIAWTSTVNAFKGCTNLQLNATDAPNLAGVVSMGGMFNACSAFTGNASMNTWNTGTVIDMAFMFAGATAFNQDISGWNTAAVINMAGMFDGATAFNQNIGGWNTAAVINMSGMFFNATVFNQNIGTWNTVAVTNMQQMFEGATAFNQNIGTWERTTPTFSTLANVTNMTNMFLNATVFNQNIGTWNTSAVMTMQQMFFNAAAFNQNIATWNTSAVTNMSAMFYGAAAFNQNIGTWNTSAVTNMSAMFFNATSFNQNIGTWNTSAVTNMAQMFGGATSFNQNIGTWERTTPTSSTLANVTNMAFMFANAIVFNQNIGTWNTAAVTDMERMFGGAAAFNQSLAFWQLRTAGVNMTDMLNNCGMNTANYDATLIGWAANANTPNTVTLGATGRTYCAATSARNTTLVATKGWTINGDALLCPVLTLTTLNPTRNALNIANNATIQTSFSANIPVADNAKIKVIGSQTGYKTGAFTGATTPNIVFDPTLDFKPGETVTVEYLTSLLGAGGEVLSSPQQYQFTTTATIASANFALNAIPTGTNPTAICSFDADGDNDIDMAVACSDLSSTIYWINVFINNGSGTFTNLSYYNISATAQPSAIVAFDANGDGKMDLATSNRVDNNVSVLLGNGDGTFQSALNYTLLGGTNPSFICAFDADGDGDIDLASSNRGTNNVSILLNNGNGTYAASVEYASNGTSPMSISSFDADGDGDMDLAVGHLIGGVTILKNNGSSAFTYSSTPTTGGSNYSATVFDANADGKIDLAVSVGNSANLAVLSNDGTGTFALANNNNVGSGPRAITSFDADGDGDLDLAVANENVNNLSILRNNAGTFSLLSTTTVGTNPSSITSFDADGDGDMDLAVANRSSGNVSILFNEAVPLTYFARATGNWNDPNTWSLTSGGAAVAAGDLPIPIGANVVIESGFTVTSANATDLSANLNISITGTSRLTLSNGNTNAIATLTTSSGSTINLLAGTLTLSAATTFNGTVNNQGGTIPATPALTFVNGATYIHARDGGTIPTATWGASSTINVTGMTANQPTAASFVQTFGNLTWNCTAQATTVTFSGTINIAGNLTLTSTGGNSMNFGTSTINVGGNLIHNITVNFDPASGTFVFNGTTPQTITGASGPTFRNLTINNTATTPTVTIDNDITVNGVLTLTNGRLVLNANDLTLVNATPFSQISPAFFSSSSTSYIETNGAGKLIRNNLIGGTDYAFPVGDATAIRWIETRLISTGTAGCSFNGATITPTPPTGSTDIAAGTWNVSATSNVSIGFKTSGSTQPTSQVHIENAGVWNSMVTFFLNPAYSSAFTTTPPTAGANFTIFSYAFITTWQTTTPNETITIPTTGTGYNYNVVWGDGTTSTNQTGNATHTYTNANTYTVSISGTFPRIFFNNAGDKAKIRTIEQWGNIAWTSMEVAFYGCTNLVINAVDAPNLTNVTSTGSMFRNASSMNANINNWDMNNVLFMGDMFRGATSFNQPLDLWDVSSAIILGNMFNGATAFNQDISTWDVNSVTVMEFMFSGATAFNQSLATWQLRTAGVNMTSMLNGCGMNTANYDATLIGWAGQAGIPSNVTLGASGLKYCASFIERETLINDFGWSITGDVVESPTCSCLAPVQPATALTFGTITTNSIEITGWNAPSSNDALGYVVVMNTSAAIDGVIDGDNPTASTDYIPTAGEQVIYNGVNIPTSLTIINLLPETRYYFKIYAYNCANRLYNFDGIVLDTITKVLVTSIVAPDSLNVEVESETVIKLTWKDKSNNEENFIVERKEGSTGTFAIIATLPANDTTYTDNTVTGGITYFYRVKAVAGTISAESDVLGAVTGLPTALEDALFDSGTSVFPNPSDGNVTIKMDNNYIGTLELILIDAKGRIIQQWTARKTQTIFENNLNFISESHGLYFILIKGKGNTVSRKLIKR